MVVLVYKTSGKGGAEEERDGEELKGLQGVATCCVILIAVTVPLKETYMKECKRKNYIVP